MPDSNAEYFLRSEAGPIPYWKHHKRAKEALNFILRGLKAAADSVEGGKGVDGDPLVDTNRASRIFFVSGEPGSGKSSLYLTLRAVLSSKEKEKYQLGYKGKINLNELKEVRWLDALDLEVASDEGENLLAAVLVRLIEVLTNRDTVSSTVHSTTCDDAIKDLEELATDIGIAWEGNLKARAGELDPDTYSEEVMRTQRARLGVNERLKKALDKLAQGSCHGCSKGTLFVLPVDDLYLKPDVSLQLLRLLRMISIPRLFFLIMGDINTVEALFIEKSLADWTEVAGTRLFAARSERLDDALTRARELRARYLRKLLPPGQRATIEAMDWYEAMDFEPSRPDTSVDSLEELLAQVKLDQPYGTEERGNESLLTFLISPPLPASKKDRRKEWEKRQKRAKDDKDAEEETPEELDLKKIRSAYSALQILDATPREMMDLGSSLREVIRRRQELADESGESADKDKNPILLSSVRDIVNLVREEQNFLNEEEQGVLEGILPTRHYYPEDINFVMERLCVYPAQRTWKDKGSGQLWIRNHRSWDMTVNHEFTKDPKDQSTNTDENEDIEQATDDPFAKLPPRPAAWFILLHDLAWEWNPDSVTGNIVERMCDELNDWRLLEDKIKLPPNKKTCLQSKQRADDTRKKSKLDPSLYLSGGWAIWSNESTYKHFPMPDFKQFRDLDRFLFIWSRGIVWLEKKHQKKAEEAQEQAELIKPETELVMLPQPSQAKAVTKITQTQESQRAYEFLSLWALAGWTILAGAYKNYAESGDQWYADFDATTGESFVQRFTDFKEKLKDFELPKEGSQIETWLLRLKEWTEKEMPFLIRS